MASSTARSPRPLPAALRVARFAMRGLGTVSPASAGRVAARLYFTPRRHRRPGRERAWLDDAFRFTIDTRAGALAAHVWHPSPFPWDDRPGTALLVHGWEGRGSQLGAFAAPLTARGVRVVAVDLPGHGASPGERTDVLEMSRALQDAADALGDVRFVIAHSAGCAATALALDPRHGGSLVIERAVLVAPPRSFEGFAARFASIIGLDGATEARFRALVERRFGADVWERYRLDVSRPPQPTLVVHDVDDEEIPFLEGRAVAEAWPDARFLQTKGLGHRRVLRDPEVVAATTRFLVGEDPSLPLANSSR